MADDFSCLHTASGTQFCPKAFPKGVETHHEPHCFTAPVFPFRQYQTIMFKESLSLSRSALWPLLACSLQVFVLLQLFDSATIYQQENLLLPLGNCKFPPRCSRLKSNLSVCVCVCQVEAVPAGAQGRVCDGSVHLSPGAEGHHARVRGRHRDAAHGSPARRDGDRQR